MPQALLYIVQEELQHDATLAVPCPGDGVPHSALNLSRRAEPTMTVSNIGLAHRLLLNIVLRPSPRRGRNRPSESVATNGCKRDTVRGGAVATGVPHPP